MQPNQSYKNAKNSENLVKIDVQCCLQNMYCDEMFVVSGVMANVSVVSKYLQKNVCICKMSENCRCNCEMFN